MDSSDASRSPARSQSSRACCCSTSRSPGLTHRCAIVYGASCDACSARLGLCTVIVTHDAEEAALLADEIIVLDHGRVLQAGTRAEVFRAPSSPEVASLLGIANARRGVAVAPAAISSNGAEILTSASGLVEGSKVGWCVRPERISVNGAGGYEAVLLDDVDLGSIRELTVALNGRLELTVRTAATTELVVGERLRLDIPPDDVSVWLLPSPQRGDGDSSDSTFVHAG